jgi:glycyl-tRNA synthetase beta chain/uncharacterized protein
MQVLADDPFDDVVADLLALPEMHSSQRRAHHFDLTEFDHLLLVARHAHRLSQYVKADPRVCARAGILHDLGAHWFDTAAPCALAQRLEEPQGVRHAIRAHTFLPELPRTREAWVVIAADLLTSCEECRLVFRRARSRATARWRTRLARLGSPGLTAPLSGPAAGSPAAIWRPRGTWDGGRGAYGD